MKSTNKIRSHRNRPNEQGYCGNMAVRPGVPFNRQYDAHAVNLDFSRGVRADDKLVCRATPIKEGSSVPTIGSILPAKGPIVLPSAFHDNSRQSCKNISPIRFKFTSNRTKLHSKFCGCIKCFSRKNYNGENIKAIFLERFKQYGFKHFLT